MSALPLRRPAPKLRTKTGCFMCRKRRKKCDEVKPRCSGCSKNDLKCVWPAPPTAPDTTQALALATDSPPLPAAEGSSSEPPESPFSDDSAKIGLVRSPVYGLPGVKTSVEHFLLNYFRERFVPLLYRQKSHPAFEDSNRFIALGAQMSSAMNTSLALAAMHASSTNDKLKVLAMRYYGFAVSSLRKAIERGTVQGHEIWLLAIINLMCVYENWNTNQNSSIIPHLKAAGRVVNLRLAKALKSPEHPPTPMDAVGTEVFIYNLAVAALFDDKVDEVGDMIDWDKITKFLDFDAFPDGRVLGNAPFFGSNWRVYRDVFLVTCLSHQLPLGCAGFARARRLSEDLSKQEHIVGSEVKDFKNDPYSLDRLQQSLLYIHAGQILCMKVLRPDTTPDHPRIKEILQKALALVKRRPIAAEFGPDFRWPLAIFSCAITTEQEKLFIRQKFEKMWFATYCGDAKRVWNAVEGFWRMTSVEEQPGAEKNQQYNGNLLDVLISGVGLLKHPTLRSGF